MSALDPGGLFLIGKNYCKCKKGQGVVEYLKCSPPWSAQSDFFFLAAACMPNVFLITVSILPARRLGASCQGGEGGHYSSGTSANPKGRSRPPSSCLAAGAEVEVTENKCINHHTPLSPLLYFLLKEKFKK